MATKSQLQQKTATSPKFDGECDRVACESPRWTPGRVGINVVANGSGTLDGVADEPLPKILTKCEKRWVDEAYHECSAAPPLIPRKGMTSRNTESVSSKGWFDD